LKAKFTESIGSVSSRTNQTSMPAGVLIRSILPTWASAALDAENRARAIAIPLRNTE